MIRDWAPNKAQKDVKTGTSFMNAPASRLLMNAGV